MFFFFYLVPFSSLAVSDQLSSSRSCICLVLHLNCQCHWCWQTVTQLTLLNIYFLAPCASFQCWYTKKIQLVYISTTIFPSLSKHLIFTYYRDPYFYLEYKSRFRTQFNSHLKNRYYKITKCRKQFWLKHVKRMTANRCSSRWGMYIEHLK